jgi:hypothetical protein
MNLNQEKRLLDDRRCCEDRRKSASGPASYPSERRLEMQRRILNLDAMSVDEWLADHQSKRGLSHQITMISQ